MLTLASEVGGGGLLSQALSSAVTANISVVVFFIGLVIVVYFRGFKVVMKGADKAQQQAAPR